MALIGPGLTGWRTVPTALVATIALALPRAHAGAQERHIYVAEVVGAWEAISTGAPIGLSPLLRISSLARVRYTGDAADGSSALLVLRDARTLGKARIRCDASNACARAVDIVRLRFERGTVPAGGSTGALYATIGERASFRERLRLVGARGDDRSLAVTVLANDDGRLDVAPIVPEVGRPAGGLIARFCALSGDESDDCLDSRRLLPTDCGLDNPSCSAQITTGAYRVDVYAKERTMLSTVAVASGFAVVVNRQRLATAISARDALVTPLLAARAEFSDDEWRALLAAATLKIAGDRP